MPSRPVDAHRVTKLFVVIVLTAGLFGALAYVYTHRDAAPTGTDAPPRTTTDVPSAASRPDVPALALASYLFDAGNDVEGALAAIEEALARVPDDHTALVRKAALLAAKGSLRFTEEPYGTQAVMILDGVLSANPRDVDALFVRGYAHEIMQHYDDALADYAAVLAIAPDHVVALNQTGHVHDLRGERSVAVSYYKKAAAIAPNLDIVQANVARVALRESDFTGAETAYRAILSTTTNAQRRSDAQYGLGVIALKRAQYDAAAAVMDAAVMSAPASPMALSGRATADAMAYAYGDAAARTAWTADGRSVQRIFDDLTTAVAIAPDRTATHLAVARISLFFPVPADDVLAAYDRALGVVGTDITLMADERVTLRKNIVAERAAAIAALAARPPLPTATDGPISLREWIVPTAHAGTIRRVEGRICYVDDTGATGFCFSREEDYTAWMDAAVTALTGGRGFFWERTFDVAEVAGCNNNIWLPNSFCNACGNGDYAGPECDVCFVTTGPSQCGSASGTTQSTAPSGTAACASGALNGPWLVGDTYWWHCGAATGCHATKGAAPVCGNGIVETGEQCDGGAACTSGCTIALTPPPSSGGSAGSSSGGSSAPVVRGSCGGADGGTSCGVPTGGLCAAGAAGAVSLSGTTYNWRCSGNGGSENCSAAKYCGYTEVTP